MRQRKLRKLLSGATHKKVATFPPFPSTVNNPFVSMSQTNIPVTTTANVVLPSLPSQLFTSHIKVLHTNATVREFSGTGSDYSARECINFCEDVVADSIITEGSDKIRFVRSKLQQGSRASLLVQASALTRPPE